MSTIPLVVYASSSRMPLFDEQRQKIQRSGAELVEIYDNLEEITRFASRIDILITGGIRVKSDLINLLEKCRLIAQASVGFDNVDVETATLRGIPVENAPGFCAEEVSNHIITMLLSWSRRLTQWDQKVRQGQWFEREPILRLSGQTLGLIGFGNIGRGVSRKAQAFGLNVIVYDPFVEAEKILAEGVGPVNLEDVLRNSDYVSMQSPLNSQTRGFMDRKKLSKMKKTAFLINCSRGGVIKEGDLIEALKEGTIAGAGLDVFEQEPIAEDHPFLAMRNVILTPHSAGYSEASIFDAREMVVDAAIRVLTGKVPQALVNPAVLKASNCRLKEA